MLATYHVFLHVSKLKKKTSQLVRLHLLQCCFMLWQQTILLLLPEQKEVHLMRLVFKYPLPIELSKSIVKWKDARSRSKNQNSPTCHGRCANAIRMSTEKTTLLHSLGQCQTELPSRFKQTPSNARTSFQWLWVNPLHWHPSGCADCGRISAEWGFQSCRH